MHWSDGGRRLHWSRGATLLSADLASLFANAPLDEKAPKFTPPTEGVSLSMTREAAKHEGIVVITGAKIVTMADKDGRSEEHTSELQSLMRTSYAVFCLKKKQHS